MGRIGGHFIVSAVGILVGRMQCLEFQYYKFVNRNVFIMSILLMLNEFVKFMLL